jgi:hypothetical protein
MLIHLSLKNMFYLPNRCLPETTTTTKPVTGPMHLNHIISNAINS